MQQKVNKKFFFFFQAEDGIRDRNVTGVQTCALPISIFPTAVPIDEMKVIASELAIVIRVGIFKTTIIIGTSINAPAAPTIPAATPTISAKRTAKDLLNVICDISVCPSSFDFGKNIITTATVANTA